MAVRVVGARADLAFAYLLILLPFISSAFVNAIRDLLAQQPVGTDIWIALAWCIGVLVVAYGLAMVAYRRKITQ